MSTLLGAKEFAKLLGVSLRTIDTLDKRGELPASLRVGHLRRWRMVDVETWILTRLQENIKGTSLQISKQRNCCSL